MKELTSEDLRKLKQWHERTVRKCKTCGDKCLIIKQGKQK